MSRGPLREFVDFAYGKGLPETQRIPGEFAVYGSGGYVGSHNKPLVSGPGIIVGRKGSIGSVYWSEGDFFPIDTTYYVVPKKPGLRLRYIYYLLKTLPFTRMNTDAAVPGLNRDNALGLTVMIAADTVQEKIVSVLSAYDDLIENNRRRIHLLEESARLLYKEWFVRLRFPGHEHVKVVEGVPEGWTNGTVADFYSTASGGTPSRKTAEFFAGQIPWVKTQELTGCFIHDTEEHITDEALKRSSAKLYPAYTTLVAMYGATIGQVSVLATEAASNQACCAVMPKADGSGFAHAYLFFSHHRNDLVSLGQGAAQNNISQQVIRGFRMLFPDKTVLSIFAGTTIPMLKQIENLERANAKLAQARDLLLPRLINAEVSV